MFMKQKPVATAATTMLLISLSCVSSLAMAQTFPAEEAVIAYKRKGLEANKDPHPLANEVQIKRDVDLDGDGRLDLMVWNGMQDCGSGGCHPDVFLKTEQGFCATDALIVNITGDGARVLSITPNPKPKHRCK